MKNIFYAKEHIFVCAQKNLSVPKKGDFCAKKREFLCEKEKIFVRKEIKFDADGNFPRKGSGGDRLGCRKWGRWLGVAEI
ncbi:hypothetical protein HQ29_04225 [Porphyromonas canoris]|nr:hypothetical protein HQ29_04225 [Porphyromonas canoris]